MRAGEARLAEYCTCEKGQALRDEAHPAPWESIEETLESRVRTIYEGMHLPRRVRDFTFETSPARRDPEGRVAYQQVREFVETFDGHRWLLLTGPFGTCKTGLLVSAARALVPQGIMAYDLTDIRFLTATELFDRIKEAMEAHRDTQVLRGFKECDLLLLDDVGAERPSGFVQERFFSLLNYRYDEGLPTWMTTNLELDNDEDPTTPTLCDHLTERVMWRVMEACDGAIFEVKGENRHKPRVRRPSLSLVNH